MQTKTPLYRALTKLCDVKAFCFHVAELQRYPRHLTTKRLSKADIGLAPSKSKLKSLERRLLPNSCEHGLVAKETIINKNRWIIPQIQILNCRI